jgi:hypothetical protein
VGVRRRRVVATVFGCALVVGVVALVLPTLASAADTNSPSDAGVVPVFVDTGGQSNDCELFGPLAASEYSFRIANPKSQAYSGALADGTPFTVTLSVASNGKFKDKFFDFSITGGVVASDVGVKGGTQTARYNYLGAPTNRLVAADGRLHATLDNQSNLYNLSNVTFCLTKGAAPTIAVTTYHDKAKDGSFTAGTDAYLNGWTAFVDANGNSQLDGTETQALTSGNGTATLTVAAGAAYRICEVVPSGWFAVSTSCSTTGTLALNGSTSLSFGNYQKATVTASTYWDKAGDGGNTSGVDSAQIGWIVFLDSNGNSQLDPGEDNGSTVGGGGSFAFGVDPGTYRVCEVVPTGWTNTDPGGNANCKSTGALQSQGTASLSFGNNQKASITGRVFDDTDGNGGFGGTDLGISTLVTVYDASSGLAVGSSNSTANGLFTVSGVNTGLDYRVCAVSPIGAWSWNQTLPSSAITHCGALEFPNPSAVTALPAAGATANIGAQKQASISGTVFNDTNDNHAFDSGEGVSGWTVRVYRDGSLFTSAVSGSGGTYTLAGLPAASSYAVCVVRIDSSWTQTYPTSSSTACGGVDEFPLGYGYSPLGSNQTNVASFGAVVLGDVSGKVFYDTDLNGTKAPTEGGLTWRVDLYRGSTLWANTTAAADGSYSFVGVPVDGYRVCVVPGDGRWKQTAPPTSGAAVCNQAYGGVQELPRGIGFTLTHAGESNANFGNVQIANLAGSIFVDETDHNGNFNRTKDPNETLFGGPTSVYLLDSLGTVVQTATSIGTYSFVDVPSGSYTICLGAPILGYGLDLPYSGTTGSTSCSTPGSFYRGYAVTVGAADQSGLDFGIIAAQTICSQPSPLAGQYEVKLAHCKDGQFFTVDYSDTGQKIAAITPLRTDLGKVPMIEKITWTIPGTHKQFNIIYDDTLPYGDGDTQDIQFCLLDPRDGSPDNMTLASTPIDYTTVATSNLVLPGTQTSCLLEEASKVSNGKYVAYIYSAIDGWRSTP